LSERVPNIFVVSAPSGAGKSTILRRVLAELDDLRFSVSHTTRPPRAGETDGVEYHFVPPARFQELVDAGELLEWAKVHENLYGTAYDEYRKAEGEGVDLLLDLDVQGAGQVRKKFPDVVCVFLLPPSYAALEARIRGRGQDDEQTIRRRLDGACLEVSFYKDYDYAVVNADLEACVEDVKCVIRSARLRTSRMNGTAGGILDTFQKRS
jgi:guanylate kinase